DADNCSLANGTRGLQGFIFDLGLTTTFDCTQDCGSGWNSPFTVNTCGLVPGQAYYLVIDGCAGSECDFTVSATGTQGGDFVDAMNAGPFCDDENTNIQLVGTPAGGTWTGPGITPGGVINPSV